MVLGFGTRVLASLESAGHAVAGPNVVARPIRALMSGAEQPAQRGSSPYASPG
jgi:hypothetical protein